MEPAQAERLGRRLRELRESQGTSIRALADRCGFDNGTLVRIEQGKFAAPSPDKLARLAAELHVPLADIFTEAGYVVPDQLPSLDTYLRARYDASDQAIDELCRAAAKWGFGPLHKAREPDGNGAGP